MTDKQIRLIKLAKRLNKMDNPKNALLGGLLIEAMRKKMARPKRLRFRFFNRIYAGILNYFWLPCPKCGKMFGGHEAGNNKVMTTPYNGYICCKEC